MKLRTILIAAAILLFPLTTASANHIYSSLPDTAVIQPNAAWVKTFFFVSTDFNPPYTWTARVLGAAPAGEFGFNNPSDRTFSFTPAFADTGKLFIFETTITDSSGKQATLPFSAKVDGRIGAIIEIEKTHGTFQGMWEYISVSKVSGPFVAGSFNFKICYNGDGLLFDTLTLADTLTKLGWKFELSNVRTASFTQLGLKAPVLSIQAFAPAVAPTIVPDGVLFTAKFLVSNNRTFECQFIPIQFAWSRYDDNTFTTNNADTIFSCLQVVDYEGADITTPISSANCSGRVSNSLGGPCRDWRYQPRTVIDIPNVVFRNGGVDLVCGGIENPPGDLNLNAISYEIADFELMSRWLAFGDSVLDKNPAFREAQIYTSDANQDGTTASVADMVYLARVVVGDALPFPKLNPYQKVALCEKSHDTLFVESNDSLAGILILFKADEKTSFENLSNIEMITGRRGSLTTLLFKPSLNDLQGHIPPGRSPLVRITGKSEIQSIEISDYNGNIMNVRK